MGAAQFRLPRRRSKADDTVNHVSLSSTPSHVNPWQRLPRCAPYVLSSDADIVAALGHHYRHKAAFQLQTQLLPEPFVGSPDAPVYVLGLNPGYAPGIDDRWHRRAAFRRAVFANLKHAGQPFPFYFLAPEFIDSPGARWWRRKCKWFIEALDAEIVSRALFCLESFPYHSQRFAPIPKKLAKNRNVPSFSYTEQLLEQAIADKKPIIAMRAWKRWQSQVPGLRNYRNLIRLRSPQNVVLSPNNLVGFDKVLRRLDASQA